MATTEYSNPHGNDATLRGIPDPEFMQLQSSDHLGMVMVSALLTGSNNFAWSRAVKRALTAKMKVDFIDGTTVRPPTNTEEFRRWNRIDSMVTTWILNCMIKELAESFMYVGSLRELWIELEPRYVTKAYSMLIRMEKQMQMSLGSMETNSGAAFQIKG
ncbi:UNVERIFIED_CONTAM: hypothetical protein Sindi_0508500 [Sesamum indicum]